MESVLTVDPSPQTSFSSSYTSSEHVNHFLVIIATMLLNLDVQQYNINVYILFIFLFDSCIHLYNALQSSSHPTPLLAFAFTTNPWLAFITSVLLCAPPLSFIRVPC